MANGGPIGRDLPLDRAREEGQRQAQQQIFVLAVQKARKDVALIDELIAETGGTSAGLEVLRSLRTDQLQRHSLNALRDCFDGVTPKV